MELFGVELLANPSYANGYFGRSIALSGDGSTLVVGSPRYSESVSRRGAAYVYRWVNSAWQLHSILVRSGASANEEFGYSVACNYDGSIIALSSETYTTYRGAYIVFALDVSDVYQQRGGVLYVPGTTSYSGTCTGLSLDSSGDTLAIGSMGMDSSKGRAHVFDWNGASWVKRGDDILAPNQSSSEAFGASVALSPDGESLIVGGPWASSNLGKVYVYTRNGAAWDLAHTITGTSASGQLGASCWISASKTIIYAGASYATSQQGIVERYSFDGLAWNLVETILAPDTGNDRFGYAVSANPSGDFLVVGAPYWDGELTDQGAVHFLRSGTFNGSIIISLDVDSDFGVPNPTINGSAEFTFSVSATTYFAYVGRLTGESFSTTPELLGAGVVTGESFTTFMPSLIATHWQDGALTGESFATRPELHGSGTLTGTTPSTTPVLTASAENEGHLTGGLFATNPELFSAAHLIGTAFRTHAVLTAEQGIELTGSAFVTQPELYGAGHAVGASFRTTPELTATATNEAWLTGGGFVTSFVGTVISETSGFLTGTGFATEPSLHAGASLVGSGFVSSLNADVSSVTSAYLTGHGFKTEAVITAEGMAIANLTGGGFVSSLWTVIDGVVNGFPALTGYGFVTTPILRASELVEPASAFVMNVRTGESSRYTEYPFTAFVEVAGRYYGVKADGLYLLEGLYEGEAFIETKETDFGSFHSKNVPYVYLNTDTATSITPKVDGADSVTHTAQFNGRKTHLSRGLSGRYWRFKIQGIQQLEGLELLPQHKQRRVK